LILIFNNTLKINTTIKKILFILQSNAAKMAHKLNKTPLMQITITTDLFVRVNNFLKSESELKNLIVKKQMNIFY